MAAQCRLTFSEAGNLDANTRIGVWGNLWEPFQNTFSVYQTFSGEICESTSAMHMVSSNLSFRLNLEEGEAKSREGKLKN